MYEYSTTAGLRSEISAHHEHTDGVSIGMNPGDPALLLGIFNNRPVQPKFIFTWDVTCWV